jgi:hypothetical protein
MARKKETNYDAKKKSASRRSGPALRFGTLGAAGSHGEAAVVEARFIGAPCPGAGAENEIVGAPKMNRLASYLYAPAYIHNMSDEELDSHSNGCGSKYCSWLVPNTIYFLNIKDACDIHDITYLWGCGPRKFDFRAPDGGFQNVRSAEDKAESDRIFLNNLLRIIDKRSCCKLLAFIRRKRAFKYYEAVSVFGGPSYWDTAAEEAGELTSPEQQRLLSLSM